LEVKLKFNVGLKLRFSLHSIYLFIYLLFYLSIYLFISLFIYLYIYIYLTMYYLFFYLILIDLVNYNKAIISIRNQSYISPRINVYYKVDN